MKLTAFPILLTTTCMIWYSTLSVDAATGVLNSSSTDTCITTDNCIVDSGSGEQNSFMSMGSMQSSSSSGDIDNEISSINESITDSVSFDSAPISPDLPLEAAYNVLTSWEIMHRTPMLVGFMWIGEIAKFITPAMYIGTPFADNRDYMWAGNPSASDISDDPTTYTECIQHQSYLSFGLGERISDSDTEELKLIAKSCAQEFYGSYFEWKEYTTREEFLMMMFAMFEEPVDLEWEFTEQGEYIPYSEDASKVWYTPFVTLAQDLWLFPSETSEWIPAQEVSDEDIITALSLYTAYRMEFDGDTLDRGMITTEKMKYNIAFPEDEWLVIRIQ